MFFLTLGQSSGYPSIGIYRLIPGETVVSVCDLTPAVFQTSGPFDILKTVRIFVFLASPAEGVTASLALSFPLSKTLMQNFAKK
jgi:hypothetical protein